MLSLFCSWRIVLESRQQLWEEELCEEEKCTSGKYVYHVEGLICRKLCMAFVNMLCIAFVNSFYCL